MAEDVVVWNWPLRDESLRSWLLLAAVAASVGAVWMLWQDVLFSLLAGLALLISLWRLWLPVRWELGLTGITQTALGFRRRIPWMAIARFDLRDNGVWLYADRDPAPQRAVFIAYAGQRTRITACVDYYLGTWTRSERV